MCIFAAGAPLCDIDCDKQDSECCHHGWWSQCHRCPSEQTSSMVSELDMAQQKSSGTHARRVIPTHSKATLLPTCPTLQHVFGGDVRYSEAFRRVPVSQPSKAIQPSRQRQSRGDTGDRGDGGAVLIRESTRAFRCSRHIKCDDRWLRLGVFDSKAVQSESLPGTQVQTRVFPAGET